MVQVNPPIAGVTSVGLLEATKKHGQRHTLYIEQVDSMAAELLPYLLEGDLVLTLGAGDIVNVGENLLEALAESL